MAEGNESMVSESGEFTQGFRDHVSTIYPESKVFDDVKDLPGLIKSHHDTKSDYGTKTTELKTANEALTAATTKMEGGLFPLAEDAGDEAKSAYAVKLATLNGFDGKADSYKLPRIEVDGKEIEYKEAEIATEKAVVEMCIEKNVPPAIANHFTAFYNELQKSLIADQQVAFKADCAKFDTDFPGDNKQVALRSVYRALEHFASDELKAQMKKAKLFDTTDLSIWDKFVPIDTIRIFEQVHAKTMVGGELLGGGVLPNMSGVHAESDFAKTAARFPNQPEMLVGKSKDAPASS